MDSPVDNGRWLTYGEIAAIRRTTRASAERLARRMKWRRQSGNDGFARVMVPAAFLARAGERAKDSPRDERGEVPPAPDVFQAALSMLEKQLAREGARADKAEATVAELRLRNEDLTVRVDEAEERADRALIAAREAQGAAEEAERRAETETMARAEAEADAAELRRAEAVRKARGRWARLKAAWRGERRTKARDDTEEQNKLRAYGAATVSAALFMYGFIPALFTWNETHSVSKAEFTKAVICWVAGALTFRRR
jgi:hypothetical protein